MSESVLRQHFANGGIFQSRLHPVQGYVLGRGIFQIETSVLLEEF
jgi:hypothetical protein